MSAGISPAPTLDARPPHPTPPGRATRRRSSRRPSSRLAAAAGAVGLALALAACGSSEPDTVEEAVAEAAGGEVPEALEDIAESLDDVDVSSDGPTPEAPASEDEAGQSESGSGASGSSPRVGDCLDHLPTPAEIDADAIPVVDCAGEHGADVYALADMSRLGEEYPGFDELYSALSDECGNAYLDHFGGPVEDTGIVFDFVTPHEESWVAGETDTFCYAFSVSTETYSGELEAEEQ